MLPESAGDGGTALHIPSHFGKHRLVRGITDDRAGDGNHFDDRNAGEKHCGEIVCDAGEVELLVEVADIGNREFQAVQNESSAFGLP